MRRTTSVRRLLGFLAIAGTIVTVGCNSQNAAPKSTSDVIPVPPPSATGARPAETAAAGIQTGSSDPHASMDMGSTKGLTPQPEIDGKIASLGKSGGSKKELAALYVKRGNVRMMDDQASPHAKYPAALSDFRKALKLDPSNQAAASNKDLIEGIYRGMGKPIPAE